jgi:hypothetical protein
VKLIEVVMWIFPWLTPIPTAWLIGRAARSGDVIYPV